jgi:hypothetical protein
MRLRWWLLLVLIVVLLGVRLALPGIIRAQVNERLGQMPAYSGTVGDIDVAFWRGAYVLKDLTLVKRGPRIPVAFLTVPRMEVALDWPQFWRGRRVARVTLEDAQISFVDSPQPTGVQTGAGVSWRHSLDELAPVPIGMLRIERGTLSFHNFGSNPPVDLQTTDVQALLQPLDGDSAQIALTGSGPGAAQLQATGSMEPRGQPGRLDLKLQIRGLELARVNALMLAYYDVDFSSGSGDVTLKLDVRDERLRGYAEPHFHDLKMLGGHRDPSNQRDNPFHVLREAIASALVKLFEKSNDQFSAHIDIHANLDSKESDALAQMLKALCEAAVGAFRPQLTDIHRTAE